MFGCTLDGDSAFEVVDREVQKRELFFAGEEGEYWQFSNNSYINTKTQIKMDGNLSRPINEELGVRQGHIKSSDNFRIFINPCLVTLDESNLGYWIGPVCVSTTGVADDIFLQSDNQHNLQYLLDIASKTGKQYRIIYGAAKTKITVVGSKLDMEYYKEMSPWTMDDEKVEVVENNEHLGLVVSGEREEEKNIDDRLRKGRGSLFSLLGPAFAQKCLLSPNVKMHLFRLRTCPIVRCGLSSMVIRQTQHSPMQVFQRKCLKSFLSLSERSSTAGIHFLLGELPLQGRIDRDVFSLFYNIWCNKETKIYQIVKYLLENSPSNSRTWSMHVKSLAEKYKLPSPSTLLEQEPMTKHSYKSMIMAKIVHFYENDLKEKASVDDNLKYFNVSDLHLNGKSHPVIGGITTTSQAKEIRPLIKMLLNDYYTYEKRSIFSGGTLSPHCRLPECQASGGFVEDVKHILTQCLSTAREETTCSHISTTQSKIRNPTLTLLYFLKIRIS